MSFGVSRFRRLLTVSCFSMAAASLAEIVDTAIAGQILGETALGAIGLFWPCVEVLYFLSSSLAGGTAVFYAMAAGRSDAKRMSHCFSNGLVSSILIGLACAAGFWLFRDAAFAFFGAGEETFAYLRPYWNAYLLQAAVYPVCVYLNSLVSTDGDTRICGVAFLVDFSVNVIGSYALCSTIGVAGCALGTVAGSLAGMGVVLVHFFRSTNSLHFRFCFSPWETLRWIAMDFPESGNSLLAALVYVVMNKVVVSSFGSGCLPLMAVVVTTYGFMFVLYGIGNAMRPIVGVYWAEGNHVVVRRVMHDASRFAIGLGLGLTAVMTAFPGIAVFVLGLDSSSLVRQAETVVRIVSCSFVFFALCSLFSSYYILIERLTLALTLLVLSEAVMPLIGSLTGLWVAGFFGFWIGYALAAPLTLAVVTLFIRGYRRERTFPLFLPKGDGGIHVWDFALKPEPICETAQAVQGLLLKKGEASAIALRGAMLVEESLMAVYDGNAKGRFKAEVSLFIGDGVRLILRDDGTIRDLSRDLAGVDAIRGEVLSSSLKRLESRYCAVTTGVNRNAFVLRKPSKVWYNT